MCYFQILPRELIGIFLDEKLRGENKGTLEEELDGTLDKDLTAAIGEGKPAPALSESSDIQNWYTIHGMLSNGPKLEIHHKILKSTMNIRRFITKCGGFFNITEDDKILVRGENDLKFSHMLSHTFGLGPKLTVHSDVSFETYHGSYSKTALFRAKRLSILNTTVKYGMRDVQDLFDIIEMNNFTKVVFLNPKFESFQINPRYRENKQKNLWDCVKGDEQNVAEKTDSFVTSTTQDLAPHSSTPSPADSPPPPPPPLPPPPPHSTLAGPSTTPTLDPATISLVTLLSTQMTSQMKEAIPEMFLCLRNEINNTVNSSGEASGNSGEIEITLDLCSCPEHHKVRYSAGTFNKRALTWWNGQINARGREEAMAMPWENFKALLQTEFCPKNELQKLEVELSNHVMKGADHIGYTTRYHELVALVPDMVPTLENRIDRYVDGLPACIQGMVVSANPTTVESAVRLSGKLTDLMVASGVLKKEAEPNKNKAESSKKPHYHQKKKQKTIRTTRWLHLFNKLQQHHKTPTANPTLARILCVPSVNITTLQTLPASNARDMEERAIGSNTAE
ncbi:hypothetical protein E3N88_23615 [Mikania micrantha]|uniref:Ty3 transposon capsid-like protein domain-containing protein n=1 Tax=Mikania micrantha TaxID=192012 RepID=A0A5N6NE03_9ASTR|nr:hypothetical protein E3N88_23615 [Mikania micrantha]